MCIYHVTLVLCLVQISYGVRKLLLYKFYLTNSALPDCNFSSNCFDYESIKS